MKLKMRKPNFIFGMLVAILICPTAGLAQNVERSPKVVEYSGGAAEVRFRDGCRIRYDINGRRSRHYGDCREDHYRRAAAAARDYYRGRGSRGRAEEPTVTNRRGAGVNVTFRNGCRISYDRDIRQIGSNGQCRRGQYARAAAAARDYYRGRGSRERPEEPAVTNRQGAGVNVTFRNGCRISYDRDIRQIGSNGRCRRGQYARAAVAARDYYRGRGSRARAERPTVTDRRGAGVNVTFRNGCLLAYDRDIRQIEDNGRCRRGQYRRAADAARDYYRRYGTRRQPERPTVTNRRGAGVNVTFRNGCLLAYDRNIRQIEDNGRCRRGQYRWAADAARDYYRSR